MKPTFPGMFPPTPTEQAPRCLVWLFNSAPVFSLYSSHAYGEGWACECVSLHSALNEPIIGVYVALMCVSVRRETLHHSPPNQWGLACYASPRFFPLACPLLHHSFLISALHFLSPILILPPVPSPFNWQETSVRHQVNWSWRELWTGQDEAVTGVVMLKHLF